MSSLESPGVEGLGFRVNHGAQALCICVWCHRFVIKCPFDEEARAGIGCRKAGPTIPTWTRALAALLVPGAISTSHAVRIALCYCNSPVLGPLSLFPLSLLVDLPFLSLHFEAG